MPNIDLDAPRLSLAQAARKMGVHVNTIHRWRQHGIHGRRLRTIRIGHRRYVLERDLDSWIDALSDPPTAPPEEFARRADDADARAEAMGI